MEGTLITTRDTANQDFYGRPLSAKQLLLGGTVTPPTAVKHLYAALAQLMDRVEKPQSALAASRWAFWQLRVCYHSALHVCSVVMSLIFQ